MSPTEVKPLANLAKKIVQVMAAVGAVKKDKRNDFHKYNYASDEAIVSALRAALIANNVAIVTSQKTCEEIIREKMVLTKLGVEFELIDADSGETKTVTFFGYGSDAGDKGVYKAATGAEKYFLMKTFLIPTSDDPEFEKNQAAARRAYSTPAPSPAPKPATPPPQTAPSPVAKTSVSGEPSKNGVVEFPAPAKNATREIVKAFVDNITQLTAKASGAKFYKLNGTEGESWTTFSKTVAENAKALSEKGTQLLIALDRTERGAVAVGVKPA